MSENVDFERRMMPHYPAKNHNHFDKVNPFLISGLIVVVSVHLRIGSTLHGSMRMKQPPRGVKTLSQIHAASRHRWGVGSGTIRQISGKNFIVVSEQHFMIG